jgi:hypothetical protein
VGLTYVRTASPQSNGHWYQTPEFYALVIAVIFIYLNIKFF